MVKEKQKCLEDFDTELTYYRNMYDHGFTYERYKLKAYNGLLLEKLSETQVFEKLKPEKPPVLDDDDLDHAIHAAKKMIEQEEREDAFYHDYEEEIVDEQPVLEAVKPKKSKGKTKIKPTKILEG